MTPEQPRTLTAVAALGLLTAMGCGLVLAVSSVAAPTPESVVGVAAVGFLAGVAMVAIAAFGWSRANGDGWWRSLRRAVAAGLRALWQLLP